jgi:phosphopantetheinyl transferase
MAIKTFVLENYPEKEKRHSVIEKTIREYLGDENIQVLYTGKGKPYIKGVGKEKYISVTTKGKVMVLVCSDMPVGIDGEYLGRFGPDNKMDYTVLSERFFSEEEAEYVRDGDGDPMRFVRVWVRKEAYVKFTGKGLVDFPNFSVTDGERFYSKINGVPIKKFNVNFPGSNDYLFAIAGAE